MRQSVACALTVVASLLVSGCGTVRLHSETREKQGQAATKAWGEVDLKAFFNAERENQAKILEQELASTERVVAVARETEIRELATKPIRQLPDYYDESLKPLLSNGSGSITAVERDRFRPLLATARLGLRTERERTRQLQRDYSFLLELGMPNFTCAQLTSPDPSAVDAWKSKNKPLADKTSFRLGTVVGHCKAIAGAETSYRTAIEKLDGGQLKSLFQALKDGQQRMDERHATVDAAKKNFEVALAAYNAEVEAMKAGQSTAEKAKEFAEKAASALDAVKQVNDIVSDKFVSEKRIERIDALLGSLKAGTVLETDDASKLEIAISMFPTIADDIRAIGQAKKGRAAVPLLIQRDIEQARLNAANIRLAIEQKDLALRRAAAEIAFSRALALENARRRLFDLPKPVVDSQASSKAIHAAWSELEPDQRVRVLESTTQYLDAFARQQASAGALTTQRLALAKDESIGLAEVNASMWSSLIGATVNQAAEFSALGIKAADIEKILNVLGVFYIGHGVN